MQQNEYLLAKIGVDTAENEPLQIWGVSQFNIQFGPYCGRNRTLWHTSCSVREERTFAHPSDGFLVNTGMQPKNSRQLARLESCERYKAWDEFCENRELVHPNGI